MNKIYKLVWSKVRNTWVVASEIAKGHGKNASATRERKLLKTAVITAIMGGCLMTGGLASAALTAEQQAVYDAVMAKLEERGGNHYVSITTSKDEKQGNYDNKGATGSDSIAIGGKAVTPSNGSIALGSGAVAGDVNKLPKDNAGRMISIGNESHANNQNTIALGNYSKAYGFMGIAIGTEALTTNDKRPGYNYTDGIAVGNYSISDGTSALAIGERSIAQASNAVSIGKRTYASEDSFAGGNAAIAQSNSIALGHGAVVYQEKKYWDDNKAGMDQMINATKGADAEYIYGGGDNKGWFAYKKMATPNFSAIAVGAYSQVTDIRGTAIGYAANAASKDALAMGTHATVTKEAERGVALGTFSVASRKGDALGYNPVSGKAFENEAEVAAYLGKADEYKVLAEKIKTQQEDYKAKQAAYEADKGNADKRKAANEAKTELSKSVSEKYTMLGAFLSRPGAVSVGDSDFTRQITNVAAGSEDTDAVNVAQLKALNKKVEGNKIHYLSIGPDNEKNLAKDGNYNNDGADSHWGIAIGVNASSKGSGSIAIGKGSQAHGTNKYRAQGVSIGSASRAIGAFATAVGHDTKASGEYSSAYGMGEAYGRGSMAIGWGAIAALKPGITKEEYNKLSDEEKAWYGKADYADQKTFYQFRHKGKDGKVEDIKNYGMAIGAGANSFDNAGLAVGFNAKTNKDFGVALGGYSVNKVEQGVALGTSSVADREKDVKGYLPTTGKVVENFEEAMKAAGKEEAFKELKAKYLAAQENLTKAQEAYKADQSPTNMMNLDKAQKELKGLTEEYAVMTAPWTSRRGAVSVGNDKTGFTRQITGVAAGSEDTDAVNVAQLKALNTKVDNGAIHYVSVKPIDQSQEAGSNYLNDGAKGDGGIAIGQGATSQGRGIAMGYKSNATPKEGTKQILNNAFEGIAIGQEAHMEVPGGIAIGLRSKVEGTLNTKDGNVNEQGTVALGTDAFAKGNGAAAFGWKAKGIGEGAMAFGTETEAKESGTAFGGHAKAAAGGIAVGWQAHANDLVATSVGTSSDAGRQATAIGAGTTADGTASTAVGLGSVSKGERSTALGAESVAEEAGSIALGTGAVANTKAGAVGYIATGGSATFEEALATLDKKEDYDKWTATVNASKAEYDNLTKAFNDASKDKKDEAKQALDDWKVQHADFVKALTAKEKLEATWKATEAAVSVGADGVDKAGNRIIKSRQITNVAAGTRDTDAVNVAQLRNLATAPMNFYFGGTKDKTTNVYTPGNTNWSMSLNEFRMDFGDGLKAEKVEKDGKTYTLVTLNKDSLKNDPAFKGDKGDAGAAGKDGKSAYDIWKEKPGNENKTEEDFRKDLKGEKGENGKDGAAGKDGKSAYDIWKEKPGNENKTEEDFRKDLKGEKGENGKDGAAGKDGKSAYDIWKEKPGNENKTEKDFLDSLKGKDGKDGVGGAAVEAGTNISVDKTDPAKAIVSLKKEITVDSVNAGGVTIDKAGINAGGKKVTGVAPGDISKDSTDAVNGSQLFAMNQKVESNMNQINNLRDESREGDAMGAAMAALKPIDFDPYQRSQVMAGVGYYRGKEAVALGLAHYKNEDLMFHGGLAYAGSSELMANIGVTYRFGSKDDRDIKHDRNLRMPQYAEGPISSVYMLQDEVERLTKENKEANDRIAALEAKLEQVLEKVK